MSELACGIDIGSEQHVVRVLDETKGEIYFKKVFHNLNDFKKLCNELKIISGEHGKKVVIGLEGSMGYASPLDRMLVKEDFEVIQINSERFDKYRRLVGQPKRNDDYDSYIIASFISNRNLFLSKKENNWHLLEKTSENCERLKILTRYHKQVVRDMTRESNRLRKNLLSYFPVFLKLYKNITALGALSLLKNYSSIKKGRSVKESTLANMKIEYSNYRLGIKKAVEYKKLIEENKYDDALSEEISYIVSMQASTILELKKKKIELEKKIKETANDMEEVKVIKENIVGAGDILASRVFSEIGTINRFRKRDKLMVYFGVTCLDDSSGKREVHKKVYACNKYAKDAIIRMAFASLAYNKLSMAYYKKKRREGKSHYHALKCLAKHMLRFIHKLLIDLENKRNLSHATLNEYKRVAQIN